MKKFSDLNIKNEDGPFVGKKKDMEDLFDHLMEIHDFRIMPAKYPDKGYHLCLHLQIKMDGKLWVAFSGSKNLVKAMEQVNKDDLPIEVTIRKKGKMHVFE